MRAVAGASGLAAFALFATGNALWAFEQPAPDASPAAIRAFYDAASGRIVAGGLVSLTSLGVLAVFAVALRLALRAGGDAPLAADAAFAGLLLAIAPGLGAETVNVAAALRAADGALTDELAVALFDVSFVLGTYAAAPGLGVMVAAVGCTTLLPRPLAIACVALGVLLVTPAGALVLEAFVAAPAFLVVAAVSVRLLRPARRAAPRRSAR